jgi:hydrogenase expression/formation protein HypC
MCLAVPGCIESIDRTDPLMPLAIVRFGGVRKEVNLAYVPEAEAADYVLVHVGFALSRLDPAEANRIFALLDSLADNEASPAASSPRVGDD